MSARGYLGTTMSELVRETGLPKSAIYHHFESKAGLLSEVMAQGARRFFDALHAAHRNPPDAGPRERMDWYLQKTGKVFVRHEDFLRLLINLVMNAEAAEAPKAMQVVTAVRGEGIEYMHHMIGSAFSVEGEDVAGVVADELAHFAMVCFDGAFVARQSGDGQSMSDYMRVLTDALVVMGESRVAALRGRA